MKTNDAAGPVQVDRAKEYPTLLAERDRLASVNAQLVAELEIIANANPADWDKDVRDQFQQWAQNRAKAAIAAATKGE